MSIWGMLSIIMPLIGYFIFYHVGRSGAKLRMRKELSRIMDEELKWAAEEKGEGIPMIRTAYRKGITHVVRELNTAFPPDLFGIKLGKKPE